MKAALILNGDINIPVIEDFVICADGGVNRLVSRAPDIIIGDLDSAKLLPKGVKTLSYPPEKNYTDGELCLEWAANNGYGQLTIYGATGGRADHILVNLSLLALAHSLGISALIKDKNLTVRFSPPCLFTLPVAPGDQISILPYGGPALIKSAKGVKYPLDNLLLSPFQSGRGISNIATDTSVQIEISQGFVLIFHYNK